MKQHRKKDPEMFAVSGYMDRQVRETFLTLVSCRRQLCSIAAGSRRYKPISSQRALNAEVASIPEATRGNMETAALRFQFWRDLVKDAAKLSPSAAPHPLLPALQQLLQEQKADPQWILRMIDARERDMDPQVRPYASLRDLEAFADDTQGSLLMYQFEAADSNNRASAPLKALEAAETCMTYMGRALALTTLLRGFSHHSATGDCYLPLDVVRKHDLRIPQIIDIGAQRVQPEQSVLESLSSVVFDIASLANAYAEDAAQLCPALSGPARSISLQLTPSTIWLEQLQKSNFDIQESRLQEPLSRTVLHWRLLKNAFATAS